MTSLNGIFEAATRNADIGNNLAIAAGNVVARRVCLGWAAVLDPMRADHAEFGRMVPEKLEAFSAAGMIMLQQATQAGEHIARLSSDAATAAARATVAVAGSDNPLTLAATQGQVAMDWFEQAAANCMAIGMIALGAQAAALVPIQQAVAANTARLGN